MNAPLGALMEPPTPNSYWVVAGSFVAGEYPGRRDDAETSEHLNTLLAAGVDAFIDLTMPGELDPYVQLLPPHVEYDNKPLRDHDVPDAPEQMLEILAVVADALRRNRTLYLHCRAGIGRTGMVVGCWLANRGLAGEAALDELNRLWQANERSRKWLLIPETPEQQAFVRDWRAPVLIAPGSDAPAVVKGTAVDAPAGVVSGDTVDQVAKNEPAPVAALDMRDRFRGCLLGLAVGDALAVSTQGLAVGNFTPVTEILGGGAHALPAGAWTDETAMALCLADSLLAHDGFDRQDLVERLTNWQTQGYLSATGECLGISNAVARALGAARFRRHVFAGSHDPHQLNKDTLTRVAPCAMFFLNAKREAIARATEAARVTCQAPLVLRATAFFAACVHAALLGFNRQKLLSQDASLWSTPIAASRPTRGLRKVTPDRLMSLVSGAYRAAPIIQVGQSADALDALQAALWAFTSTTNFHDGAIAAVNLGGESDAIGAIYGQLAGAHYGAQAIPEPWRKALIKQELLTDFADRLLAAAQASLNA